MKYTFGYGDEDAVEIPELDAFRAELDALCMKHGVAFEHERGWSDDSGGHVKLVPYDAKDANKDLFDDLDEADKGIPWLDAARVRYEANQEARRKEASRAEAARRVAQTKAHAEALLTHGVLLDGKTYKLVPKD